MLPDFTGFIYYFIGLMFDFISPFVVPLIAMSVVLLVLGSLMSVVAHLFSVVFGSIKPDVYDGLPDYFSRYSGSEVGRFSWSAEFKSVVSRILGVGGVYGNQAPLFDQVVKGSIEGDEHIDVPWHTSPDNSNVEVRSYYRGFVKIEEHRRVGSNPNYNLPEL